MNFDFAALYSRKSWSEFFRKVLLPHDFTPGSEQIALQYKPKCIDETVNLLGSCPSLDLNIYEMHHESLHDPRITISRDAFRFLEQYKVKNALILFISRSSDNYRLSLITRELKLSGKKVTPEFTNPKRYSYLLGPGIKMHTVQEYLFKKGRVKDEEDLRSRFSVEIVNKDFYNSIAEQFSRLVGGVRGTGNRVREFQPVLKLPGTTDPTIMREFSVRLIGRVVFCWFLKKKKSAAGKPLISDEVLSSVAVENYPGYYHRILEPLFFEVMNRKLPDRREEVKSNPLFRDIPFLNGGLFDHSIHRDFYEPYGPDSEHTYSFDLKIDDEWFTDFFSLLELYNFTIDENTPVDIDISVDPEMLGRIFENLLAEINPETQETARKNTGSYYTPRPIVEYMVDESLTEYLLSHIPDRTASEQKIRDLLDYRQECPPFSEKEKEVISNALDNIRILDPACGSGAFPMGILQKMLLIRQKVDPESLNWIVRQLDPIRDPALRKAMEDKLMNENWDYRYKMSAILHSIYGVDIQPIAVEIAKLRFFLTLIVEEEVDDSKPNRGVNPLPNLSFKFVAADTLLDIKDYRKTTDLDWMEQVAYEECIRQLEKLRENYFYEDTAEEKSRIQTEFQKVQKELSEHLIKTYSRNQSAIKLASWNPFSDEVTDWFNPQWMFGLDPDDKGKGFFDIVIGNPPYIQLQSDHGKLANRYKNEGYSTFCRTGDIYSLFYERGVDLLKKNGILCYITSNKWMRAKYGEATRKFFSQYQPLVLIDLGSNIFESATVDTNILLIKKTEPENNSLKALDISREKKKENFISHPGWVSITNLTGDTWTISSPIAQRIKEKIERLGKPLKEWDIGIYYGIKTGYNQAFIIDSAKREELLSRCQSTSERQRTEKLLKPILRGRDIKRYKADWAGLWLIFIPWHFPFHEDKSIQGASDKAENEFKSQFPTIYDHLLKYKDKLSKRNKAETGIRYEWYALQRCAATYYQEFDKEKIVWAETDQMLNLAYVMKGIYLQKTCFMIVGDSLNYLHGILNSKLSQFYIRLKSPHLGMKGMSLTKETVTQIPIMYSSGKFQHNLIKLTDQTIKAKESNQDTEELEAQIDQMVYQLYNLTPEEINFVEQ